VGPNDANRSDDTPVFPILRGESVGEAGEFTGKAVIVCGKEDLNHKWMLEDIAILHHDLEKYFMDNPDDLNLMMSQVSAIIAEFGDSVSELAAAAYHHMTIAIVKVTDATSVLENDMHIRVFAHENQGDIFFID